jgi:GDP-L-fucose synthase
VDKERDFMHRDAGIYVAGHRGLVGSALMRGLEAAGYRKLITRTHADLDLMDQQAVRRFFEAEKPEFVLLAAAKVGGILANNTYPADFIYSNLTIQANVIQESWRAGVKRLLFLGSSCIYPRDCPQPIKEEYLLTGPLEQTNRPYAVAKIAGIEMCWSYNRQYGTQYLAVMPTNLYGPGDNYDLQKSHVIPALLRKTHEAKERGDDQVVIWGSGTPRREFLYSDDMANACLHLMNLPEDAFSQLVSPDVTPLVNIGCGEDVTIAELAETIRGVVGFRGNIALDSSKPDGTPRKLLDISKLFKQGWRPRAALREGLAEAYKDFLAHRKD